MILNKGDSLTRPAVRVSVAKYSFGIVEKRTGKRFKRKRVRVSGR